MVVLQLLDSSAGPLPFSLTADLSDSITHIRAQISSLHPAAPAPADIRLVRGGRLLRDGETVQDVLGSEAMRTDDQGPHLIHLVLRPGQHQPAAAQASTSSPSSSSSQTTAFTPRPGQQYMSSLGSSIATVAPTATASSSSTAPSTARAPETPVGSGPGAHSMLPFYHALPDALSLYCFLSNDALCEMLSLPRQDWSSQTPPPLVSLSGAEVVVKQTMEAVGIESALDDALSSRRSLDEWVRPEGQQLEVSVDGAPYMLDIPPIGSLSENEQFAIQRYLMYTTRLSLLEALLRSHPPAAPQAMHGNPSPSAIQPIDRVRLGTTLTLVSMSLIKYAFVWWIFTQEDTWLESLAWAAGLAIVWIWETYKSLRRLHSSTPALVPTQITPPVEDERPDGTRPLPPLPTYQVPPSASPLHSISAMGLAAENHRLLLSAADSRPLRPTPPPSFIRRLFLPVILLFFSVAPPLDAHRRRLIRERETAMRSLSSALAARAARQADNVTDILQTSSQAEQRLLPEGLPSAREERYWRRVVEREERVDWAEEEEAQRRMGGDQAEREREQAEGGLLALFF